MNRCSRRVENILRAGEVAGLGVHDLITLLDAGMSIEQLVDYLAAKLTERPDLSMATKQLRCDASVSQHGR